MKRIALYRKYRPQSFDEVIGQDHIVSILKNAVRLNRVSHAYLFSGPRGTGKTSIARILAKEAGCSDVDLIEIDAASSRGIDEIRALRDGVRFAPLQGKVKVYIIDEVHMLTKEAFNALLKTLEEPPSHVIFILATTEPEKVPETIISRCQHFSFRKIPEDLLKKVVIDIARKEGFELDGEAGSLIALSAEGSFRDAQAILDQVLVLGDENKDKKISGEEVRKFLALPSRKMVEDFIIALIQKDAEGGIKIIQAVSEQNLDISMFLKLVLRSIRFMLLMRLSPGIKKEAQGILSEDEYRFLETAGKDTDTRELGRILKILLNIFNTRPSSYLPQLPLELAIAQIINYER